MAKNQSQVLEALGLTSESTVEDLINKLKEYAVVSESEILNVKNISVKTLPTVVVNDEKTVKEKMIGIVTDENKGAVALMNKRNSLIQRIIEILNAKVKNFTDLGTIDENPESKENSVLNNIKTAGIYTFNNSNLQYLMLVTTYLGSINQIILKFDENKIKQLHRSFNLNSSGVFIETKTISYKENVDEVKQSILGDVSPEYSTLENIGNAIDSQQLTIDMNYEELSESIYQTRVDVTNLQNKVDLIDNRVAYLEKTKPVTAGAVVNDTLVLFNAYVDGDTLVIVGGDVVDDTLVIGGN